MLNTSINNEVIRYKNYTAWSKVPPLMLAMLRHLSQWTVISYEHQALRSWYLNYSDERQEHNYVAHGEKQKKSNNVPPSLPPSSPPLPPSCCILLVTESWHAVQRKLEIHTVVMETGTAWRSMLQTKASCAYLSRFLSLSHIQSFFLYVPFSQLFV